MSDENSFPHESLKSGSSSSVMFCPLPEKEEPAQTKTDAAGAGRQIARAAGIVMAVYLLSNLIGLVHSMVVSYFFGTSADLDSYNAANRLTEALFNLMAGGALGSAFIPVFTGFLMRKDREGAWRLASGVINVVFVVLIVVSALAWVFAPWLVENVLYLLAPGQTAVQLDQTVLLLRIMLPTVVIFGISGLFMGILNSHQSFLIPALAPVLYSSGIILGALLLPHSLGVLRLAWGAVFGALMHLSVQIPSILRLPGRRYFSSVGFKDQSVREVLRLMVPRLANAAIVQLNFIVNTMIALGLGAGSTSAVSLGFWIMLMPQRTIAQSTATAALPTLSAQAEMKQFADMRKTLAGILRGVLLLAIPATVGMILLRYPIVQTIYQRGEFDATSTQMVTWALLWYCVGLIGHCLVEILARAFYALHDTQTPVIVGVIAMTLNIGLSFLFAALFERIGWLPLGGIALANSFATTLEGIALLVLMRKRMGGLEGRSILSAAVQGTAASAVMGALVFAVTAFLGVSHPRLALLAGLCAGLLAYVAMMAVLRVPELKSVIRAVKSRLGRMG